MADQESPDDDETAPDADEEETEDDQEPEPDAAPKPGRGARNASPRSPDRSLTGPLRVSDASGLVLGLLVWGWIVVPYFRNGKQGVRDVLSAKFTNRKNGEPLP